MDESFSFDNCGDDDVLCSGLEEEISVKGEMSPMVREKNSEHTSPVVNDNYSMSDVIDVCEPSKEILGLLKRYFGFDSFRPMQWQVIHNALNGRDHLVIMSTGYGKSVCYQMPSLIKKNLTLVISPLVSLMNDQVDRAKSNGIAAVRITGDTPYEERNKIRAECEDGSCRLLYVTPEFAISNDALLEKLYSRIGLIAIDEAHCVSHWGHEFRSSYRKLALIRMLLQSVPIMALTATAAAQVKDDIVKNLQLRNPIMVSTSLDRSNIHLSVSQSSTIDNLKSLLREEDSKRGKHFGGSTIIYCSTRAAAKDICDSLSKIGVKCGIYHAGLSKVAREKAHKNFSSDRITTIAATVAFGMGIDKADIRNIIHFGAPKNIESYYQEMGRAGRDGCPSKSILLFSNKDFTKNRTMLIRDETLKEPYKSHAVAMQLQIEKLVYTNVCRRYSILSHFDPTIKKQGPSPACCDVCDQQLESTEFSVYQETRCIDFKMEAGMILSVAQLFQGRTGVGKIIDFLKGKAKVPIKRQQHKLYGSGSMKSESFWKELIRMIRLNGFLIEKGNSNEFGCTISLSAKGENWLQSEEKQMILDTTPLLLGGAKVNTTDLSKSLQASASPDCSKILKSAKKTVYKDCTKYEDFDQMQAEVYPIDLERKLNDLRTNLAIELDCGAHVIASSKCIQQLASIRPSSVEMLHQISEFPEEKRRKFGAEFVNVCKNYAESNSLRMDCTQEKLFPADIQLEVGKLNQNIAQVYQCHLRSKLSIADLAQQRSLSESTIASYFTKIVSLGLPVHMDVLQINFKLIAQVLQAIRNYRSDVSRMKPIMEKLSEGLIDYNRLKIILAIIEYEYGVKDPSEKPVAEIQDGKVGVPGWMRKDAEGDPPAKKIRSNLFR